MTHGAERPELPSRGELWSILLGVLLAGTLLASAFRVTLFAHAPVPEEPGETSERSVRSAGLAPRAPLDEATGPVVVRPEPRPARPSRSVAPASR